VVSLHSLHRSLVAGVGLGKFVELSRFVSLASVNVNQDGDVERKLDILELL